MVAAEPRPGKIPTMTPSDTPTKQNKRLIGFNEIENPWAMSTNVLKALSVDGTRPRRSHEYRLASHMPTRKMFHFTMQRKSARDVSMDLCPTLARESTKYWAYPKTRTPQVVK